MKFFGIIGGVVFGIGVIAALYLLRHYLVTGGISPHIPLAILTAILLIVGFLLIIFALLADMMGQNRKINEEILYRMKKNGHAKRG